MKNNLLYLVITTFFLFSNEFLLTQPLPPKLPDVGTPVMRLPKLIEESSINLKAPKGFEVELFAENLSSPRWLLILPNNNILVAQSRTESLPGLPPETVKILTKMNLFGPSPNNIIEISNRNGVQKAHPIISDLNQPFGMIYFKEQLYIANTDSILKYNFQNYKINSSPLKILDIPAGPPNNHWTRNIILNKEMNKILVSVGSGTNVNEEGTDNIERAAIWEINLDGSEKKLYATGLRNPVGMAYDPFSEKLWTTVNERDGLGEFLPPDYFTEVVEDEFYGWPYVYFGIYPDPRQLNINPLKVKKALTQSRVPDLSLGAHTVPLGLLFHSGKNIDPRYKKGAFIARRGGVSTSELSGYDVIFVPFEDGYPTGEIEVFLSGFIANIDKAEIFGRPVGITEMNDGSMLVTDDVGGKIWRIHFSEKS